MLEFIIGGALALADENTFDMKNIINFDCRQRIILFRLTIILQSLLKLKKRKIGDIKCIAMTKHPVKTMFCVLYWNDREISKRRLEMRKEFLLNKIIKDL